MDPRRRTRVRRTRVVVLHPGQSVRFLCNGRRIIVRCGRRRLF
ncbi:hypothetical protein [Aneurinibacillus uraniidurans]|nr:hypothetical protein [Aneurinibacillus sp. B1]WCN38747.1 hypothetical protein PO771_04905 [Aneurinibacillus sp. B1]